VQTGNTKIFIQIYKTTPTKQKLAAMGNNKRYQNLITNTKLTNGKKNTTYQKPDRRKNPSQKQNTNSREQYRIYNTG